MSSVQLLFSSSLLSSLLFSSLSSSSLLYITHLLSLLSSIRVLGHRYSSRDHQSHRCTAHSAEMRCYSPSRNKERSQHTETSRRECGLLERCKHETTSLRQWHLEESESVSSSSLLIFFYSILFLPPFLLLVLFLLLSSRYLPGSALNASLSTRSAQLALPNTET